MRHARTTLLGAAALATALALTACGGGSSGGGAGGQPLIGLITKTDTNPFFVKMKEGAQAAATAQGVELQSFAGKQDGDNEAQVQAIETLISRGAAGFLIPANDSKAIAPALDKARQAGLLIGQWAKAKFAAEGKQAKIALLDLSANGVSVDVQRDQGFLEGFGVDVGDKTKIGDESDPRIVGHDVTDGAEEGGRTAMENLLQKDPTINLVHTINEPAANGAYEALKAAGKQNDVTIVSVDGGCPGVATVKSGQIGATSQQYPLKMASLGFEAIAKFAKDGTKPATTAGKDFFDTGVELITDQAQSGVPSKDTAFGAANCWG